MKKEKLFKIFSCRGFGSNDVLGVNRLVFEGPEAGNSEQQRTDPASDLEADLAAGEGMSKAPELTADQRAVEAHAEAARTSKLADKALAAMRSVIRTDSGNKREASLAAARAAKQAQEADAEAALSLVGSKKLEEGPSGDLLKAGEVVGKILGYLTSANADHGLITQATLAKTQLTQAMGHEEKGDHAAAVKSFQDAYGSAKRIILMALDDQTGQTTLPKDLEFNLKQSISQLDGPYRSFRDFVPAAPADKMTVASGGGGEKPATAPKKAVERPQLNAREINTKSLAFLEGKGVSFDKFLIKIGTPKTATTEQVVAAVKSYQEELGFKGNDVDGIIGRQTFAAIEKKMSPADLADIKIAPQKEEGESAPAEEAPVSEWGKPLPEAEKSKLNPKPALYYAKLSDNTPVAVISAADAYGQCQIQMDDGSTATVNDSGLKDPHLRDENGSFMAAWQKKHGGGQQAEA